MRIDCIFTDRLFSFHYAGEADNEYDRLMELWTDVNYLYDFGRQNSVSDMEDFVDGILSDAEDLQDFMVNLECNYPVLSIYFLPLDNVAWKTQSLSFRKGKIKRNRLRLYAIKIDEDCFVITGGAIKMSQAMQDHSDTLKELEKLRNARLYLNRNGVFDEDSFFELLSEEND